MDLKNNLKNPLAKTQSLLYNNTMTNFKQISFTLHPEYRTINCGDSSWAPTGFCVKREN